MTKTLDFDAPLTEAELDQLYRDGKLPRAGLQYLLQMIAPRNLWGQWADKLSLVVGVLLVLAGIVFFFAFNWREMPGWQKLGLINLGLVACLVGALLRRLIVSQVKRWRLAQAFLSVSSWRCLGKSIKPVPTPISFS